MYLIVTQRKIFHDADERSRTHPGHGYPAWDETVDCVKEYKTYPEFTTAIESLIKNKESFRSYEASPLNVSHRLVIEVKQ